VGGDQLGLAGSVSSMPRGVSLLLAAGSAAVSPASEAISASLAATSSSAATAVAAPLSSSVSDVIVTSCSSPKQRSLLCRDDDCKQILCSSFIYSIAVYYS